MCCLCVLSGCHFHEVLAKSPIQRELTRSESCLFAAWPDGPPCPISFFLKHQQQQKHSVGTGLLWPVVKVVPPVQLDLKEGCFFLDLQAQVYPGPKSAERSD